jgi:methylmalonyl-CoA mutase N-terminal domain/subunit
LKSRLEAAAHSSENLMPLLVECSESYLTLGEICGVLRQAWGEYQPPSY